MIFSRLTCNFEHQWTYLCTVLCAVHIVNNSLKLFVYILLTCIHMHTFKYNKCVFTFKFVTVSNYRMLATYVLILIILFKLATFHIGVAWVSVCSFNSSIIVNLLLSSRRIYLYLCTNEMFDTNAESAYAFQLIGFLYYINNIVNLLYTALNL